MLPLSEKKSTIFQNYQFKKQLLPEYFRLCGKQIIFAHRLTDNIVL